MIDDNLNDYVHIYDDPPELMWEVYSIEKQFFDRAVNPIRYLSIWRESDLRAAGCLDSEWY